MKACSVCGTAFEPTFNTMQQVCGRVCARKVPILARKQAASERKQTKAKLGSLKTRKQHLADTQEAFNAYIRHRDRHLPCVSCGCFESPAWHASHFASVGSAPGLRFDPANVHRACVRCNLHLHGNTIPYRAELLHRIGQAELDRLEGPQPVEKWTIEELKAMRASFVALKKALISPGS